jgi:hypothetical protein
MNIYEDEELEQKLEELTNLIGRLVLDMLLVGVRKTVAENQIFSELAEAKYPVLEKYDLFRKHFDWGAVHSAPTIKCFIDCENPAKMFHLIRKLKPRYFGNQHWAA